jgi:hypothetical protein
MTCSEYRVVLLRLWDAYGLVKTAEDKVRSERLLFHWLSLRHEPMLTNSYTFGLETRSGALPVTEICSYTVSLRSQRQTFGHRD